MRIDLAMQRLLSTLIRAASMDFCGKRIDWNEFRRDGKRGIENRESR